MEPLWIGLGPWLANATGTHWFDGGSPFLSWVVQFAMMLAIELPIVVLAWRFRGAHGRLRTWLLACFIGNLISHPAVIGLGGLVGLPGKGINAFAIYVLLATGVIAFEAWVYRVRATYSWTEATVMSLAANAVTAVVGAYYMFLT